MEALAEVTLVVLVDLVGSVKLVDPEKPAALVAGEDPVTPAALATLVTRRPLETP